ncbi:hypothetical protein Hte_001286 [Hypoxylon texense]
MSSSTLQNSTRFPAIGLSSGLKISGTEIFAWDNDADLQVAAQRPTPAPSTFNRRPTGGQTENILGGIRSSFTGL